jgi:hypothetical protein
MVQLAGGVPEASTGHLSHQWLPGGLCREEGQGKKEVGETGEARAG